jgi:hypothetical protein
MKLYRSRVPAIAHAVMERLVNEGDIEVEPESRAEAEQDLVAVMEMYLSQDKSLRDKVGEEMERRGIPYDQFGKMKSDLAEQWGHPVGDDVDRYLSRQFIENFMISRFVSEVFSEDREIYKKILLVLKENDVDERAIRAEAEDRIKNIPEGVERQDALNRAMKEVRKKYGLM